jgi:feruloyl esterase
LPNTTITLAQSVAAGASSSSDAGRPGAPPTADFKQLPAFCRVAATLRPSTDSDIKIEVWLPLANWNGKSQGVSNGGLAGFTIFTSGRGGIERGMAEALKRGYATASTDTGHTGNTAAPFLGHPEKLVDFAYRAVHEMTVTAKAIIRAFYDTSPKLSHFNGCSLGGRQGLIEAQRFPDDYDGIIAGAPAISQTRLVTWSNHVGHAALKDPQCMIPSSKYPMIHRAVMNACDALDGVKDGLIDDPRSCRFDFRTIECKAGDSASCLTTAQVETAQMKRFQQRGGKLLLYHGWSDANFSAPFTIDYYERLRAVTGSERIGKWARLFLAPGMGHCGGERRAKRVRPSGCAGTVGRARPRARVNHRYTYL